MATWYALGSGDASQVTWDLAPGGSGNPLTWPAAVGDTLHTNNKSILLDTDPGCVALDGAGWLVAGEVTLASGLTIAGTVNIMSGGDLVLAEGSIWTINGVLNVSNDGRLRLDGAWIINGSLSVDQSGTLEACGVEGTVAACGSLTVSATAKAFNFGTGIYVLHADSTVLLFGFAVRPTQAIPAAGDVRQGVATGRTTGTLVVPATAVVVADVQYGAGGSELSGTFSGSSLTAEEIWQYSARSLTDKAGFSLATAPPNVDQIAAKVSWELGSVHGWDRWSVDMQTELATYRAATVGARMTLVDGAVTGAAIADGAISSAKFSVAAIDGPAAGILEQIRQVWRRFFRRSTMTASQLKTYADDGTTALTTQALGDDGVTQTQGAAQ
jgi:hypothetical protein